MTAPAPLPRRVEVLAGLSVAIDLGLGQPAEHMLRSAVIACGLADRLGLSREQKATVYYTTLLMWIGCHADSQEYARWFGDDIAVRRDAYLVDWSGLPYLRFLLGNVARGEPLGQRVRVMATLMRDARGQLAHADPLALHLGGRAGPAHRPGPGGRDALACTFERYDGGGLPDGCVRRRTSRSRCGWPSWPTWPRCTTGCTASQGAVAMARSRRGGHLDPVVVDAFTADAEALFPAAGRRPLGPGPGHRARLRDPAGRARLDDLLTAIGDFVDLKCPFALGHSRNVAALAEAAGVQLGLPADDVTAVRRAGHLHDVGRIGVSNQVWSKPAELTGAEWERVRMHPYLTDRVLTRIPGLAQVAAIARAHHEHLDGSGYPLGLAGTALGRPERLWPPPSPTSRRWSPGRTARPRPRGGRGPAARTACAAEPSTPTCVEAVLAVAGHARRRTRRDDALTPREAEILGLVARGLSNREIAARLVLSEKTVRNHVERTYAKIGATNRVGASLYALQHGLVVPGDGRDVRLGWRPWWSSVPRPRQTPTRRCIWESGWRDGHLGHVPDALVSIRASASFHTRAADAWLTPVAVVDDVVSASRWWSPTRSSRSTSIPVTGERHRRRPSWASPSGRCRSRTWSSLARRGSRATPAPVRSTRSAAGTTRARSTTPRPPPTDRSPCRAAATSRPSRADPARDRMAGMRVLIAPDKFAGTLTAVEAAEAIAEGWARHCARRRARPGADGRRRPGLRRRAARRARRRAARRHRRGPHGERVPADVLLRRATSPYVETAQACGLHLIGRRRRVRATLRRRAS